MQRGKKPYLSLGRKLAAIRRDLQESVLEVSGAVELEGDTVLRFERGEERPSEEILSLLIDHFNVKDDEADELWELAGYARHNQTDDIPAMPTLMVFPVDNRIVYTDTAHVSINNFGVVMNFMQSGPANQPVAIARIGMSLDHAKSVLEVLAKTIAQAEAASQPKQLPSTTSGKQNHASNKPQ